MPAFTWASGDNGKCSNCPANAPACYQGLCYMPKNYEHTTTTTTPSTTTTTTTEESTTPCPPDEDVNDAEAEGADNNDDQFRLRV
ncbi:hypothetical protein CAEBREN_28260 [Caenorhabditis brenneri]|uniref:Uncharacterized protein n=1 Tax=Caenorhabditis brenneri TaxID=135651 RepID=G0MPP6_CAEBE|nr:hypothetical protein CAEBREN_28260 [Caenorhabditis brenneri]